MLKAVARRLACLGVPTVMKHRLVLESGAHQHELACSPLLLVACLYQGVAAVEAVTGHSALTHRHINRRSYIN